MSDTAGASKKYATKMRLIKLSRDSCYPQNMTDTLAMEDQRQETTSHPSSDGWCAYLVVRVLASDWGRGTRRQHRGRRPKEHRLGTQLGQQAQGNGENLRGTTEDDGLDTFAGHGFEPKCDACWTRAK